MARIIESPDRLMDLIEEDESIFFGTIVMWKPRMEIKDEKVVWGEATTQTFGGRFFIAKGEIFWSKPRGRNFLRIGHVFADDRIHQGEGFFFRAQIGILNGKQV